MFLTSYDTTIFSQIAHVATHEEGRHGWVEPFTATSFGALIQASGRLGQSKIGGTTARGSHVSTTIRNFVSRSATSSPCHTAISVAY